MQKRRTRGAQAVDDLIPIIFSDVTAGAMTVFVIVSIRGERPGKREEAVLVRAGKEAGVAWRKRCR